MGRCRDPPRNFPGADIVAAGKPTPGNIQTRPKSTTRSEIPTFAEEAILQLGDKSRRLNMPMVGSHDTSLRMMGGGYRPRNAQLESSSERVTEDDMLAGKMSGIEPHASRNGKTSGSSSTSSSSVGDSSGTGSNSDSISTLEDNGVDAYYRGTPGATPFFSGGAWAENAASDANQPRCAVHGLVRPEAPAIPGQWQGSVPAKHCRLQGATLNGPYKHAPQYEFILDGPNSRFQSPTWTANCFFDR